MVGRAIKTEVMVMIKAYRFDEVLEIIESFSAEDQDALIEVVQRRRSE